MIMSVSFSKFDILKILFVLVILLHVSVWNYSRDFQARWSNVPPVPPQSGAVGFAMGDKQLSYRSIGIMVQNLGDTGGRYTSLNDYDYTALARWFLLLDYLDPHARFAPFLASFYFGAVHDSSKLGPLVNYLGVVGQKPYKGHWRWLVQAVYMARFDMNDLDKALELATTLSNLPDPDVPLWARQMPVFVYRARGEKEEALAIMLELLNSAEGAHPNEINFTRDYICTHLLSAVAAKQNSLCRKGR